MINRVEIEELEKRIKKVSNIISDYRAKEISYLNTQSELRLQRDTALERIKELEQEIAIQKGITHDENDRIIDDRLYSLLENLSILDDFQ